MAHKCEYSITLDYISSETIDITYWAYWKDKKLDVIKHRLFLNGNVAEIIKVRPNLSFNVFGGWLVAFPNETERHYYYGNREVKLYDYEVCDKIPNVYYEQPTDLKDKLKEFYPTYKYLIDKANNMRYNELFKIMRIAEQTGKTSIIEWLVENHQTNLITLNNLKNNFNADIFNFIKEHKEIHYLDIRAVKLAIKEGVEYERAKRAVDYYFSDIKLQDYLLNQVQKKNDISYYNDYKKMCKRLKKNWDDPYWRYPKDLIKAHNKVMQEIKAVELAKKIQENKDIINKILSKKKKSLKYNFIDGSFECYFPYEYEDIEQQAEELNQCLITAEYYKKYANNKSILIFVKYKNKRYATCEIDSEKHIKQFYRNESNRYDCDATPVLKAVMNKFLDTLPKRVII